MALLDHLVYAVTDLATGIDWFTDATGVHPAYGGSHDGLGTRNALVSMGDSYLELLAVDPGQPDPPASGQRPFGLDDVLGPGGAGPSLIGFAVRPSPGESIEGLADVMADGGNDPGPIISMSRTAPSGERLDWRLTMPTSLIMPFLIDWGATPMPHTTQPGGIRLASISAIHPRPDAVTPIYRSLGIDIAVTPSGAHAGSRLSATVVGPDGVVKL